MCECRQRCLPEGSVRRARLLLGALRARVDADTPGCSLIASLMTTCLSSLLSVFLGWLGAGHIGMHLQVFQVQSLLEFDISWQLAVLFCCVDFFHQLLVLFLLLDEEVQDLS